MATPCGASFAHSTPSSSRWTLTDLASSTENHPSRRAPSPPPSRPRASSAGTQQPLPPTFPDGKAGSALGRAGGGVESEVGMKQYRCRASAKAERLCSRARGSRCDRKLHHLVVQVHLDRSAQRHTQLLVEQVTHPRTVTVVEPDTVGRVVVVAFGSAAVRWGLGQLGHGRQRRRRGAGTAWRLAWELTWGVDVAEAREWTLRRARTEAHLVGEESQICLFGGCLLIT